MNLLRLLTLSSMALLGPSPALAAETLDLSSTVAEPLTWGPCPSALDPALECTTLAVPLDYRNPGGRAIDVAVSRIRAENPALRRGVLFTNPGGPGASGLDLPALIRPLLPQEVRDRYDVIGIDPRGVGRSTPVSCGLSAEEASEALVPLMQPGGFGPTAAFMRGVAERCTHVSSDLLPHMTTANTARDFDRVRAALGEERLSYLGWSYGTYLGAVYASLFPDRTDRVVLDSAVHPGWVWREQFRSWKLAGDPDFGQGPLLQPRFRDFAVWAAARDAELGFGATPEAVRSTYFALLRQATARPVRTSLGYVADGEWFRELTFAFLYGDDTFPAIVTLWSEVRAGVDQPPPAPLPPGPVPVDNSTASALAILCGDVAWPRPVEQYRLELAFDTLAFPMFGELGSNVWPCAFWATTPTEPLVELSAEGPRNVLIVQGLRDPATPYVGGIAMRQKLGRRASLLTVDQGGHAIYVFTANACVTEAVTAHLVSDALAPDGFCPAGDAPTARASDPAAARAREELRRRQQRLER
ncbi:alpha/beta fold hydrolase [Pyxidicoccus fallax]|uniref:Alpha/beta hydrolase n=1 Tax=Pyxidicoccus fallax TaxID=394095 RepID=A0A848LCH6_9BACT|nr:alpha/beta hydrolase [Pyxidicoccus fallax]NMO16669.1 alpha/beta hydrolase [Pyxidicoccus fallax]NPC79234.1 alpha/beta fold hydrolase [Pyxidicoccus fallax]